MNGAVAWAMGASPVGLAARVGAAVIAGLGVVAPVPAAGEPQTRWDLPSGYSADSFHAEHLLRFANDVAERTGGSLRITVHPEGTLFAVPEIEQAVRRGQAQVGELLMAALEGEDPLFGVDSLPFLATSYADARRLAEISRPYVERRLADRDLRLLFWVPWPPQGLYSVGPIETADDLRGLSFRSYGASATRLAELAGMQVATLQATALPEAFESGAVSSMISSGAMGYDVGLWEHVGYFYDIRAWLPKNMIFVHGGAWEALSGEERAALQAAAAAAEERAWARSEALAGEFLDAFRAHGMNVEAPSQALRAFFRWTGSEMAEDWLDRTGEDGVAILEAFRSSH